MTQANSLPTWTALFGTLDTKDADAGRSVTSPAAYLADLLQLLEDRFPGADFAVRRPDIVKQLALNGEQSFTLLPQLDIINRVLENRVAALSGTPAQVALRGARQPFSLPFELEHARVRQLLGLLKTTHRELYASFTTQVDVDVVARERLGLSPAQAEVVLLDLSTDAAGLRAAYGLADGESWAQLAELERFRRATQLDAAGLRALLYANLSQGARDAAGEPERSAAGALFIHHDLGGYVTLDATEQALSWRGAGQDIPSAWFDRVHRLLCLSRWAGIELVLLERLLRVVCGNALDAAALRRLAALVELAARSGSELEVWCALVGELDGEAALGAGDDPKLPASLFDRVFNGEPARVAQRHVASGSGYLPEAFQGWEPLAASGDLLAEAGSNLELRTRVRTALALSAGDLSTVLTRFRERATQRSRSTIAEVADSRTLSLLHRVARVAQLVDLPIAELLRLVDLIEQDVQLKRLNAFELLVYEPPAEQDLFAVLEQGSVDARLWLLQSLVAIGAWARVAGITPEELEAAALVPTAEALAASEPLRESAQAILDAFTPAALSAEQLESSELSARTARIALELFREPGRGLCSAGDARLVTFSEAPARAAAYAVVDALESVHVEDLEALSLGENLAAYLQSLLVRRGLLDANAVLLDEALPDKPEQLVLEELQPELAAGIFELIAKLAADSGEEVSLYPSDLLELELTQAQADEWIDRLTLLGVLDASGAVTDASFFLDPDNRAFFVPSARLEPFHAEIHALLLARRERWRRARLILPAGIWSGLPFSAAQCEALEQNLLWSGYLDAERALVDRDQLAGLNLASFDVALPFYRQRRAILRALQDAVAADRVQQLTVTSADLRPIADRILALQAHELLAETYLDERGRLGPELLAVLGDEASPLDLGSAMQAHTQTIWTALREVGSDAATHRLTDAALASVGLTGDDAIEVTATLCAAECVRADGTLPPEQVARFSVVNSALEFALPGYADYARDVFFVLHDVAIAVQNTVEALVAALAAVADAQGSATLDALASQLELGSDAARSVLAGLLSDAPNLTEAVALPVLQAAAGEALIRQVPRDRLFLATLSRARAFAQLARKLQLSARETEVAFRDQQLSDKLPEALALPPGADGIDVLWQGPEPWLYLFRGARYWTFDPITLAPIAQAEPLASLCADFAGLREIDAVYSLPSGEHWLLADGRSFRRAKGSAGWVLTPREWGLVRNSLAAPERIECALLDQEGSSYLFAGDQYVRYSSWPQAFVDEGYPQRTDSGWQAALGFGALPAGWNGRIDAGVTRADDVSWLFSGEHCLASNEPERERNIVDVWGRVRHALGSAARIDAIVDVGGRCGVVVGDQLTLFSNSLENAGLVADEGFPQTLEAVFPGVPDAMARGLDAALAAGDGTLYLFRDDECAIRSADGWTLIATRERWGRIDNALRDSGRVDAALTSQDGRSYLFSGAQYLRYSSEDLSRADEGYPRSIARDFGGLSRVDAAFVLDGKTYLFGEDERGDVYVRYSTRDYTTPDEGYPKLTDDNFWNLPEALVAQGFHVPDAVLALADGRVHLFSGTETIAFDHNQRWWSEPQSIRDAWPSLPFDRVGAAFAARDGRVYLFSLEEEPRFVRYSDKTFQRLDDRFPKPVKGHWGKVTNNLERTGVVDAALKVLSTVTETAKDGTVTTKQVLYRYLFSGDQFYRYSSDQQAFVDEGYPLRIAGNLEREPHFAQLDAPIERGIDGVWADRGNVFVFAADRMYAASTAAVRELAGLGVGGDPLRAAHVEDGRVLGYSASGWQHVPSPEALAQTAAAVLPRALRDVPAAFQGELSALLHGLDRNLYLFRDAQCYDRSLERAYLTGATWGRVQNRIAEEQRVDAALTGQDGKLYLFRGAQFVSYSATAAAPTQIPELADAVPASIAARFAGLENVRHAFVRAGITYLLEAPAEDGSFRYLRYSGADYARPLDPELLTGDFSFWGIPQQYVEQGFDRIDSALVAGEDLILIRGERFLHHEPTTDTWTFPRPLSIRWPELSLRHPDFDHIRAALLGPDGQTYFFGQGSWLAHDGEHPGALAPIAARWGRVPNRIATHHRVDAALVYGEQTFLFSGDEYVRYTGASYEYVDAGYPRKLAGALREEAPFALLPDDLEASFAKLGSEDVWVEGAFQCGGVLFVAAAGRTLALSPALTRSYPLQQLGGLRNRLLERARVDAAFCRADGTRALFLLSDDQYVRYSGADLEYVDAGYPRAIAEGLLSELVSSPPALPLAFQHALDAALYAPDGALVLFKGKQFVQLASQGAADALVPAELAPRWGRIDNAWQDAQDPNRTHVDAAFVAPDGALYVFKAQHYLRYAEPMSVFADEGYPRAIHDRWGDLPSAFESGIDGAFVFDGRTYLTLRDQYVRYGDASYAHIDPIYPQPFAARFRAGSAFSLCDLRVIERYIALERQHGGAQPSLTDFFLATPRDNVEPYGLLADLFGWDIADVQWLKRRDAFLERPSRERSAEVRFDLEQLLRLHGTLELCRRLGSHPAELYTQVWSRLYTSPDALSVARAADTLTRLLAALYPGDDWQRIDKQLGDALRVLYRDALVAWLVAHSPQQFADARDLSDFVLSDVEVDASVQASPITEAIAALQLFFHRYLTNLEDIPGQADDVVRRAKFKQQWRWLKNYRVWEANRKIFLYPESYIRPELRDTRTAAFAALQDDLNQGEITDDSVARAYRKYLDEYTEVSRLVITGGYVQPDPIDPEDTELTLFGATRTEPQRYYYRTATFRKGAASAAVWRAWRALGIDIASSHVYPVRAFGRTFVFWAEIEQRRAGEGDSITLQRTTSDSTESVTGEAKSVYRLKLLYSFYDLSERWASPQTLDTFADEPAPLRDLALSVSHASLNDGQEPIVVNYQYTTTGVDRQAGARLLAADLTVLVGKPAPITDNRAALLMSLLHRDEGGSADLERVVELGSAQDSGPAWYSFDHKGGSFLARPLVPQSAADLTLRPLAGNHYGLPEWTRIDAALCASDGRQYLFNNERAVYCTLGDGSERPIAERFGLRRTNVHTDNAVDAAWLRKRTLFLSRGNRYLTYSDGYDWADAAGERGASAREREDDGVPNWPAIDAAFTDSSETTWFFHDTRYVSLDAQGRFSAELDIAKRWGHESNGFTAPDGKTSVVVAAFSFGGRSYLIGSRTYTWYSDSALLLCERPKPQSLRSILVELGCSNPEDVGANLVVSGALDLGDELQLKARDDKAESSFSFKDGKVAKAKDATKVVLAAFALGKTIYRLSSGKTGVALSAGNDDNAREFRPAIQAAMIGLDGALYLFDRDSYLQLTASEINAAGIGKALDEWASRASPIASRWGRVRNAVSGGPLSAAFMRKSALFLIGRDAYVRYSDPSAALVDLGYPKPLLHNPDQLPEAPIDAAVGLGDDVCYFVGAQYVWGRALSQPREIRTRWGRIRSNILVRGVDAAYRVGNQHYLVSGDELACYTADSDQLPAYVDGPPARLETRPLGEIRGAFVRQGYVYLVGRDAFVCCAEGAPEQPLPGYPRSGTARELLRDLRARFGLAPDAGDSLADGQAIYALEADASSLTLDLDPQVPGLRVLVFDFTTGAVYRNFWGSWELRLRWTLLRASPVYFEAAGQRYSFRDQRFIKTDAGVAADFGVATRARATSELWSGSPFDAAVSVGDVLYLFAGGDYSSLPRRLAAGANAPKNLSAALAQRTPLRGGLSNFPSELADGFDAALAVDDGPYDYVEALYFFKDARFARFGADALPYETRTLKYELVRLTTSTTALLNQAFLSGGVSRLLSLHTQQLDETPGFSLSTSDLTTIHVNPERVHAESLPQNSQVDFGSANGIYLWEIFFHLPFLIAEALNAAQRFEEAKAWFEHVFDPTEPVEAWKFLPFLTEDVERIAIQLEDRLARLPATAADGELGRVLAPLPAALRAMDAAFQGERGLRENEAESLAEWRGLSDSSAAELSQWSTGGDAELAAVAGELRELVATIAELRESWDRMQTAQAQLDTYLDDPFDPHAIAALRPIAYRKAIVMRYIENLLDWGDMLFTQYTRESVNEARMLYVLAWDLLGRRPESLGRRLLPPDTTYAGLRDARAGEYDLLLQLADVREAGAELSFAAELSSAPSLAEPYFFIPPNYELEQYWLRVADRLYKIRHSLNIQGVNSPLALFSPPLDPLALVRAAAMGGELAALTEAAAGAVVPHYRFSFLLGKARELAQKVQQFGADLLAALEKGDAEVLSRLQTQQEGVILGLTREVRAAALAEAQANRRSLELAQQNAQKRSATYATWLSGGLSPAEQTQVAQMQAAALLYGVAFAGNLAAAIGEAIPKLHFGLFTFGNDTPDFGDIISKATEAVQSFAEGLQVEGELAGVLAQHQRSVDEWTLQKALADIDAEQIAAQLSGADWQIAGARQDLASAERQVEHNAAVARYYRDKFTNQELYTWMAGRLSTLHYQTYRLALDMARAAERAFQFECGSSQASTSFVQGQAWDSQRKGLLAGEALGCDLDRMEAAFLAGDARRFEISKTISLVELDALAFLKLRAEGRCEFDLGEALFDYDFPGHYCRQVKTIAIDLDFGEGVLVNATLTQLSSRLVMEPDLKAVAFLLDPKEAPPATIRSDWKPLQQIALSQHDEYQPNSGMFELRFDSDRYLPFEGTGAVSRWRLALGGPRGAYDLRRLGGVKISLKYTALQGGDAFAAAVRGLLEPSDALRSFDLSADFADAWQAFLGDDSRVLELPLQPALFPGMTSGRIRAIFTRYEGDAVGSTHFVLDLGGVVPLPDGKSVDTSGLSIGAGGTTLRLTLEGDKSGLGNAYLVLAYKAGA